MDDSPLATYGANAVKLSSIREMNEHSPFLEQDISGKITASIDDAMIVDTDSAPLKHVSMPSDVATPAMEDPTALQRGVGGHLSANTMDAAESAVVPSVAEESPTLGTMRNPFFEAMDISCQGESDDELKNRPRAADSQAESFSDPVYKDTESFMAQHDGQLDERGDLLQLQSHLSGTYTPSDITGQSQRGFRPPNWLPDALAPSMIVPGSLPSSHQAAETRLWDVGAQTTQRGRAATQSMSRTAKNTDRLRRIGQAWADRQGRTSRSTLRDEGSLPIWSRARTPVLRSLASLAGSALRDGQNVELPLAADVPHSSLANLDMNVLIAQSQLFGQIAGDKEGEIYAAAPDRYGITEVTNENGVLLYHAAMPRRRDVEAEARSEIQALRQQANEVQEVHMEDDLMGAAAANAPLDKWRRLMRSSEEGMNEDE